MLSNLKWFGVVALLTITLSAVGVWRMALIREGEVREQLRQSEARLEVLQKTQAKIDTQYVTDTLRFTRIRDSIYVVRDSVSVWKYDTLKVVEYVERTTDALNACSALIGTCNLKVATLEAQLHEYQSRPVAVVVPRACTGVGLVWGVLGTAAGFGLGRAVK